MTATDNISVDPALWPLVEAFPPVDVGADTLAAFRNAMVELSVLPEPASHTDVSIDEVTVPAGPRSPAVRCLLLRPAIGMAGAALLHVHGGGFVMGSPGMDLARNIELVRATGCAILSVDYRLAPEHPHPAGLEDCHAALEWLAAQRRALNIGTDRIGLIGESAGGGLAASLALLARDRASVSIACQALVYPMLVPPDRSLDTRSPDARTGHYIWKRASNAWCWSVFLRHADTSPLFAGVAKDLSRLPPAFLAVGDLDLFVHDNLDYAQRLLAAGVPVEAHVYPGAIHGFDRMVDAPVSQRYARELAGFLQRHLGQVK